MTTSIDPLDKLTEIDFFDERLLDGRLHGALAEHREADVPMVVDQFRRVHLLRYGDVRTAYIDQAGYRNIGTGFVESFGCMSGPLHDWQANALLVQDPPRHTAMRRAVRHFDARLARRLEPTIRRQAHDLVDRFPEDGVVNFAHEFGFRLPVKIIMGLLRLPEEDEEMIGEWSPHTLPIAWDDIDRADEVNALFREYVERKIAERRSTPLEDDTLSDLIDAADREGLTHDELWATVQTVILAGHETTSSALSIGVHTLLTQGDHWQSLREDRSLLAGASHEILRYDPAVISTARVLTADTELHGVVLSEGTSLALCITSANRDPRVFDSPDVFDISRSNAHENLTFGAGIHRCVGAPLAQLEIPTALDVLLDRLVHVEVATPPEYEPGFFRQFGALQLGVTTRPRRTGLTAQE
ncbi:cytochrome P450 [Rhodococcus sp. MEB041]|uniref:cytochrome P450 n=1 Tax=Rhodococcus sp. MEB041 TaxID=3040323 RepID=UPI00254C613F|nr:cytochrome P450 [Rhodococcus sp. MEB041]